MKTKLTTLFFSLLIATLAIIFLYGCTDNQRAKGWGGSKKIELSPNHKFLNCTWKGDEIWVTTIDTLTGVGYFQEHSKWGIREGEVVINPTK